MIDLNGQPSEIAFTITIKRAETGKEEHYDMVGHILPVEEKEDGSNTSSSITPGGN